MRRRRLLALPAAVAIAVALAAGVGHRPADGQVDDVQGTPRCGSEAALAGAAPGARGRPDGLRVATFNVLHGLTDEGEETLEARLPLAVDALVAADADIAGLQEATLTTNHGDVTRRLAQALADRTGERWWWCRYQSDPHWPGEPDLAGGGEGGPMTAAMAGAFREGEAEWREMAAIVARYPITAAGARRLPTRAYEAPACVLPDPLCALDAAFNSRVVLWSRVEAPGGPVDVFDTHLSHELTALSDATKLLQAQAALAFADQMATDDDLPDFFLGDLNSTEDSQVHAAITGAGFVDAFRRAHPGAPGFTADQELRNPARTTTTRIDYVFARPGGCGLDVRSAAVFPTAPAVVGGAPFWPSDHAGVVADVRCAAAASGGDAGAGDAGRAASTGLDRRTTLPATGGAPRPLLPLTAMALWVLARYVPARRSTMGAIASQFASPPNTK